jgi:Ca2+-binding EF-hand superfamily protein
MRSNNSILSYDELWAFFRVVDADEDGRISYSELLEAITLVPNYFS